MPGTPVNPIFAVTAAAGTPAAAASPLATVGVGSALPAPGWMPGKPEKSGTPAAGIPLGTAKGPAGNPGMLVDEPVSGELDVVGVAIASPDAVEGTAAGVGSIPPAPGWTPGNPKKSGTPAEAGIPLGTRAGPVGKPGILVGEGLPKLDGDGVAVASADAVEGSAAARCAPRTRGFVAGEAASAGPGAGFTAGLGPAMLGKPGKPGTPPGPGAAALGGVPPRPGKLGKPGKPNDPGALEGPPPCDGKLEKPGRPGKPKPPEAIDGAPPWAPKPGKPGKFIPFEGVVAWPPNPGKPNEPNEPGKPERPVFWSLAGPGG
jgi:hypothetical protein